MICRKKHVLVKRKFTNSLNKWVCNYEPKSKRRYIEKKYSDSPVTKNFRVQHLGMKNMLSIVWNMKGTIPIDLTEKGETVNTASY